MEDWRIGGIVIDGGATCLGWLLAATYGEPLLPRCLASALSTLIALAQPRAPILTLRFHFTPLSSARFCASSRDLANYLFLDSRNVAALSCHILSHPTYRSTCRKGVVPFVISLAAMGAIARLLGPSRTPESTQESRHVSEQSSLHYVLCVW